MLHTCWRYTHHTWRKPPSPLNTMCPPWRSLKGAYRAFCASTPIWWQRRIAGYAYATEFKGREAFRWTVETSVYVERTQRQGGIGRMLYEALERELRQRGFQSMCACIAYTERDADPHLTNDSVLFHERMGFAIVGHFHRCGWKFGRWYDMVWMEKLLG